MNWYLGLDGNPPANQSDFVTVVLHEIAHGLGFLSTVHPITGAKLLGRDGPYMRWLEHHGASPSAYPAMTNAQRQAASVSGPLLHFVGPRVQAGASGLTAGRTGTHVHMYAPNPVQGGSSVSHFSNTIKPDQLMEPALPRGVGIHNIGLAKNLFEDLGWTFTSGGGGGSNNPPILTPAPGSTLPENTTTNFTGGSATGATQYWAYVGTTRGGRTILNRNLGTSRTFSVRTPAAGATMWVRYWTRVGGTWRFSDQSYRIASGGGGGGSNNPPILTPAPGSTLPENTTTNFTGGSATGATQYWAYVGTTRGGRTILNRNLGTSRTFSVRTPAAGATMWVRYWTRVGGTWRFSDQSYRIASGGGGGGSNNPPILTPAPGSTLPENTTTNFTGGSATGATQYWAYVGTTRGGRTILNRNLGTSRTFFRADAGGRRHHVGPLLDARWGDLAV